MIPENAEDVIQQPKNLQLATVAGVYPDGLSLIPDDQTEPTQKHYKFLGSAYPSPAVGDRVVVMKMSGTYVVVGSLGVTSFLPAANTVYAGPESGSAAAAAFRSLVAADLPVVPISKGGTGQSGIIVETEAQNIVTAAEGWTITGAFFAQWGKLAMIFIEIDATQAMSVSASVPVANVVAGKRPRTFAPAQAWLSTSRAALITTDGDLRLSSGSISAGNGYSIMSVYMLA